MPPTPDLRYPVGEFVPPDTVAPDDRRTAIDDIEMAPAKLRDAVAGLSDEQLDTPYRPGGWTVRQVVHHLPDSHTNGYFRLKLALTEETPTIRAYDEKAWAELPDSAAPIAVSLDLLAHLHTRWVILWRSLTDADWTRPFHHPEAGDMRIDQLLALYAWHGKHHVAHVTALRAREGW